MITYQICYSHPNLLHLVLQSLVTSMLWQMTLFSSFLLLLFCPFLLLYSIVYYMYHVFTHSTVDGHLGCFHVLAIVTSAAINIGVLISFQIMVFFRYMPSYEIAG